MVDGCIDFLMEKTAEERAKLADLVSKTIASLREKAHRSKTPKGALERLMTLIGLAQQLISEGKQAIGALSGVGQLDFRVSGNCFLVDGIDMIISASGAQGFSRLLMQAKQTFALIWNGISSLDMNFWYALAGELAGNAIDKLLDKAEEVLQGLIGAGASMVNDFVQRTGSAVKLYEAYSAS